LSPKKPSTYRFKLFNPNNQDVKVLCGVDCKNCGIGEDQYMKKEDFNEKLEG